MIETLITLLLYYTEAEEYDYQPAVYYYYIDETHYLEVYDI